MSLNPQVQELERRINALSDFITRTNVLVNSYEGRVKRLEEALRSIARIMKKEE